MTITDDPDQAFDELFRRQYAAMVRLAHLLTRSNLAAEDLVQDAFVRVRAAWDRVEEPVPYLRRGRERVQLVASHASPRGDP